MQQLILKECFPGRSFMAHECRDLKKTPFEGQLDSENSHIDCHSSQREIPILDRPDMVVLTSSVDQKS